MISKVSKTICRTALGDRFKYLLREGVNFIGWSFTINDLTTSVKIKYLTGGIQ
jgi:hypothetical protein